MPSDNAFISITVNNQKPFNTPWYQSFYTKIKPDIQSEIESLIVQEVSKNDYYRIPSSNAVYDFVVNYNLVIDHIDPNVKNRSPSSETIYNEFNKIYNILNDNESKIIKYIFNEPLLELDINHNRNTDNFLIEIRSLENELIIAPYKIIDLNNIKIFFTEPTKAQVLLRF